MVAIAATDEEPCAVCHERGGQPGQQGEGKIELVLSGKGARSQQNRRGGQRNPKLLHQNPGEEQQVAVREQNVFRQSHKGRSSLRLRGNQTGPLSAARRTQTRTTGGLILSDDFQDRLASRNRPQGAEAEKAAQRQPFHLVS